MPVVISYPEADAVLVCLHAISARRVVIGHARDRRNVAAADAFVASWERAGGSIDDRVDWPEQAASWLRQARRFAAGDPDAWVVFAHSPGWRGMVDRLVQTAWRPERTVRGGELCGAEFVEQTPR